MAENTVYLITGANRGIGFGLLEALVARPSTTVVAAVRDVEKSTKVLSAVKVGAGSKIITVKIDSTSETDPAEAAAELKSKYGLTKVDVLVSNAGLFNFAGTVLETTSQAVRDHFEVNTIGPLTLVKAFYPLLSASPTPRFFAITSTIGSIASLSTYQVPFFAYGISKAAANYLVVKLHHENPSLISIAFNPGWVQTDMGNFGAKTVGMESAPLTTEQSITALVKNFDDATIEQSGTFISEEHTVVPW